MDSLFEKFLGILINTMNISFPIKQKKRSKHNTNIQWFSDELRNLRATLQSLIDLNKVSPSNELTLYIKNFRKHYKSKIRETKRSAYTNYIVNSNNPVRASWEVVNTYRGVDGHCGVEQDLIAEDFNYFFSRIADELLAAAPALDRDPAYYMPTPTNCNFSFKETTFIEVRNALDCLKNKTSKDIYDMNIPIIKALKNILIIPLTKLLNLSIKNNTYPSCFKNTKVIPVYKKGEKNDLNNYRPISLIPVLSKVYELILKQQLYRHFEENSLFSASQFGFRAGLSTTSAILDLLGYMTEAFEGGQYVRATYCDLSKAFDCVPHEVLLRKLSYYGLDAGSVALVGSYLVGRRQKTFYNGKISSRWEQIRHGVPQGSILGPLLFLIYINDINNASPNTKILLYADDTSLIQDGVNLGELCESMNARVEDLKCWFVANKLTLNESKTVSMTYGLREIDDNTEEVKFLGVYLDPTLKFEKHVDHMAGRLTKSIYLLKNLARILPLDALMQTFHAVFQSIAVYAIMAWGHSAHARRIFALQRRAVRIVAGLGYRDDVRQSFRDLKILTIPGRYIYECILYCYKNAHRYAMNASYHNYPTRAADNIRIDFHRLERTRISVNYYSPLLYNKLSNQIKTLPENTFTARIKEHLTVMACYSIDEFLEGDGF